MWVLACWHAFVAGQENPDLPLPYAETTTTPNEADRSTFGPTEPTTRHPDSEPSGAVRPRQQNSGADEGPALKTSVPETEPSVTNMQTNPASSGPEISQEYKPGLAVTQDEFRNSDPISAVQATQHDSITHDITTNSTTTALPERPTTSAATTTTDYRSRDLTEGTSANILNDVELTTNSTTTALPERPTTSAATTTTTDYRSRDLTEGTSANILNDVELTTNSNTTKTPELPTTTTLAAPDPIFHALTQGTLARTGSGLESSNSTPVPVAAPDTPTALGDGPAAAVGTATSAVSVVDFVTGAPLSTRDPTSRGASRNNSRTSAGSLRPRLRQQTRRFRCVTAGCFPSMSSSRDYYCCRLVGSRFLYYKGTCPVGQGFGALFRPCGFQVRPVLPYLFQQNGTSRTNSPNDTVIWRIATQQPRTGPINLPTYLLTAKRK
jgi:hypothetical protein